MHPVVPGERPLSYRSLALTIDPGVDVGAAAVAAADREVRQRAIVGVGLAGEGGLTDAAKRLLEAGVKGVEKLRAGGASAALTPAEETGIEAVVHLVERPALLVQNDNFPMPPEKWKDLHTPHRNAIRKQLPSVGRIDIETEAGRRMNGTGFVVGNGLVLTNRHVVAYPGKPWMHFGAQSPSGKWKLIAARKPTIDFKMEHGVAGTRRFRVVGIAGVHDTYDAALLRVAGESEEDAKHPLPPPAKIGTGEPGEAARLYTTGYPAGDSTGATPKAVLDEVFGGVFEVKRLAPGQLMADFGEEGVFSHDCTTLGGNSGSCVVDLAAGRVVGLHFRGWYGKQNDAVSLWRLSGDEMFADVEFD
jgi:S1-C subfamily serine protease